MKEIVKGVVNHLIEGDTPESKRKMDICLNECEEYYEDIIFGNRCRNCGCVLKLLTKSDKGCPKEKW